LPLSAFGGTTITVRPLTVLLLTGIQKSAETETLNANLQPGRPVWDKGNHNGKFANLDGVCPRNQL
jgi:hypothetical protein